MVGYNLHARPLLPLQCNKRGCLVTIAAGYFSLFKYEVHNKKTPYSTRGGRRRCLEEAEERGGEGGLNPIFCFGGLL